MTLSDDIDWTQPQNLFIPFPFHIWSKTQNLPKRHLQEFGFKIFGLLYCKCWFETARPIEPFSVALTFQLLIVLKKVVHWFQMFIELAIKCLKSISIDLEHMCTACKTNHKLLRNAQNVNSIDCWRVAVSEEMKDPDFTCYRISI